MYIAICILCIISVFISNQAWPNSGDLIKFEVLETQSKKKIDATKRASSLKKLVPSQNAVKLIKIWYESRDPDGNPTNLTGLLALPILNDQMPSAAFLAFQHGTVVARDDVPSKGSLNPTALVTALIFSSQGFITIMPDYLGLGDSEFPYHPYLHLNTQAWAARDMILAVYDFCKKENIRFDKKLFIAGYSQGGHAALSLLQDLSLSPLQDIEVIASMPMAGPYDLAKTSFETAVTETEIKQSFYSTYIVESYQRIYKFILGWDKIFTSPLDTKIPEVFDGKHSYNEALDLLNGAPQLFTDEFKKDFLFKEDSIFRKKLIENSPINFKPKGKLQFCHARGDHTVSFENAIVASESFKKLGIDTPIIPFGEDFDHGSAAVPCLVSALKWFQSLR